MIPPCDSGPPPPPSDHPARDVPDDRLLYAASVALGSLEPRSRSHALSAALKDNDARVRRDAAWALGASARRLMTLFPPSSRPSGQRRRGATGGSRSPGETQPGCGPFEAQFAEQAPEGSKEPTDLTLAGEGLKGCGDSGLLIQVTHNHVSSCGFQFRGAPSQA